MRRSRGDPRPASRSRVGSAIGGPYTGSPGTGWRDAAKEKAKVLGSTWDQAVELERILIVPYVARAVERRFTHRARAADADGMTRSVLVPREERVWQSILAPIYLQLFEALAAHHRGRARGRHLPRVRAAVPGPRRTATVLLQRPGAVPPRPSASSVRRGAG